jgi:molecular chaperone IbpA
VPGALLGSRRGGRRTWCPTLSYPCCSHGGYGYEDLRSHPSLAVDHRDRLFDLLNASNQWTTEDNYPPYNIERTGEDHYQISLALAGFTPDEVTITAEQNVLTVEGAKSQKSEHQYLYQGISARPFRREFNLADYVQVRGASFSNGLLKIELVREVPEAMKPRRITINTGKIDQQIEHKQAA